MGPGGRAFVVSLLAFAVFGVALAAWNGGDDEAAESVAGGGASGGSGESASTFTDPDESVAGDANRSAAGAATGNASAENATGEGVAP